MNKLSSFAFALGIISIMAGCKKDDVEPDAPKLTAKEAFLAAKNWRITASSATTTTMGQSFTFDSFKLLPACKKDNFAKFNADKTGTVDEGALKCNSADPQSHSMTWAFNTDESRLTITYGSTSIPPEDGEVVEISATVMKLRNTKQASSNGIVVTTTTTNTYTAF